MGMHLLCSSTSHLPAPLLQYPSGVPGILPFGQVAVTGDAMPALSFCCRDIGLDCSFAIRGETRSEIFREIIRHAEYSHNMAVLPAEVMLRIRQSLDK